MNVIQLKAVIAAGARTAAEAARIHKIRKETTR